MRRRLGERRIRWRCTLPDCALKGEWQLATVPEGADPAQVGDDALEAHYARVHREQTTAAA